MRFWDASALVPLCLSEPTSNPLLTLLHTDHAVAVWWGSLIECWSTIARRGREGSLSLDEGDQAVVRLSRLQESWYEIQPSEQIRGLVARLLRVHPLSGADALQLAAALVWIDKAAPGEFVTLDHRLHTAARLEGFRVLP